MFKFVIEAIVKCVRAAVGAAVEAAVLDGVADGLNRAEERLGLTAAAQAAEETAKPLQVALLGTALVGQSAGSPRVGCDDQAVPAVVNRVARHVAAQSGQEKPRAKRPVSRRTAAGSKE